MVDAGVLSIAAGPSYSLALKRDGTVWTWGDDAHGGPGGPQAHPVNDLTGVVAIAAGGGDRYFHSLPPFGWNGEAHRLALKNDGTVWAWGDNGFGQLGNGTNTGSSVPVKVSNLTGVMAIAAGHNSSFAIRSDGAVWGWGDNSNGQLGNGSKTNSNVPVKLSNLTGVVAIAVGSEQTLAVRSDGAVWVAGCLSWDDDYGSCTVESNVPVAVSGLSGVLAVAVSGRHSLGLKSDGTVLQSGTGIGGYAPLAGLTGAVEIATAWGHSLAVVTGGIPGLAFDSRAVDFGNQGVGASSLVRSINLTNSGDRPLEIGTVTLLGIDAGEFTKTGDTCSAATLTPGGSCGITVKFSPTATGSRTAALLVSSNAPGSAHLVTLAGTGTTGLAVTVVTPNGGEKLFTGNPFRIDWTAGGSFSSFDVWFSSNGASNFINIPACTGLAGTARRCTWAAPSPVTAAGRIRVIGHVSGGGSASDTSDGNFSIVSGAGQITLTAPNTAVQWGIGGTQQIKWTSNLGPAALVSIDLSRNNGTTWTQIGGPIPNTGTFAWLATAPATTQARIRVSWANGLAKDMSNVNFTIAQPLITVTVPSTAAKWAIGSDQMIKWTHNLGTGAFVKIEVSRNGGGAWTEIAASAPNTGNYRWNVTGPATTTARIRVSWTANSAVKDISNVNFAIGPPFITVTKPNGGEQWKKGSTQTVTWSSNLGSAEFVKIELSTDGGVTWLTAAESAQAGPESTLAASTPSDGSQQVALSAVTSTKCRMRITWIENSAVTDISNANFSLVL